MEEKSKKRKKILVFSLAYYPAHVGGAEVAIKEITDRIGDTQFDVLTLRFDKNLPKFERINNTNIYRIGFAKKSPTMVDLKKFPLHLNKYLYQFFAPFHALKLHKKNHYDGFWAMMAHSTAVSAAIFKTLSGLPYVLTLQEGDPIPYIIAKAKPVMPLFKKGFRKATVIQTISTFLANWAKVMDFKGPIEVIPNAVNTKHFSQKYSEEELDKLKNQLGKKSGDVYMITTSRLVQKNAVDDVIKSLPYLPGNIKFLILGTGPDFEMLKNLAKKLKMEERVLFLGQIDHKEVPKYLRISEIFIRPSLSEGMGNSFVEAMAAGLPVIATQEGGISDFLFDPEKNPDKLATGRAVNPRDPQGIARAVKLFLEDKEKTAEIVVNAKKLAFEKYDWDLIAKDMREKVFDKLSQQF